MMRRSQAVIGDGGNAALRRARRVAKRCPRPTQAQALPAAVERQMARCHCESMRSMEVCAWSDIGVAA